MRDHCISEEAVPKAKGKGVCIFFGGKKKRGLGDFELMVYLSFSSKRLSGA